MADDDLTDDNLDTLFAAARRQQPQPSAAWLDRVEADASAVPVRQKPPAAPSLWAQLMAVLGGRPGMGGLVAASAAGLWLGVAPPAMIGDPVGTALGGAQTVDLLDGDMLELAALMDEG